MFKKTIRISGYILLFIASTLGTHKVKADHGGGGELRYIWKSGDTYDVYFRFFRDCGGIPAENVLLLCYWNVCNNDWNVAELHPSQNPYGGPNSSNITPVCPGQQTTCQNPNASLPGYQERWYKVWNGGITLPSKCHEWRMQTIISKRNASENLLPQANMTAYATLNNLNVSDNSSTFFSVVPATFVCDNFPFTYNNGAIDPNSDSLVFDVIQPLNGGSGCPGINSPAPFTTATPPYVIPNNPFQTNNTFTINSRTGEINFVPSMLGTHTVTVRVKEYRGPILVGSVIRDVQIRSFSCTPPPLFLNTLPPTFVNSTWQNNEVTCCVGDSVSFCYDISTNDPTAVLVASDNHTLLSTTASSSYTGQASDNIRGCFSFVPSGSDVGLKTLAITVKDSSCKSPGIIHSYTLTIPIRINGPSSAPSVITPIYLCHNEPAQPLTANGSNLLWYATQTGSTGSTTAITPTTANLGKTSYYVSQNYNGCESARVPIVGDVQPKVKTDITTSIDSVCYFEPITFTDNATNSTPVISRSWDVDEGGAILTGDSLQTMTAEWNSEGQKKVIYRAANLGCVTLDTTLIEVLRTPLADWEIPAIACRGQVTELFPYKELEAKYEWTIDDQNIIDDKYVALYKLVWTTLGVKNMKLITSNAVGCSSIRMDSITVRESPKADIISKNGYLCVGKEFELETEFEERVKYAWTPAQYFTDNGFQKAAGIIEQSGNIYLHATNTWGCVSVDSIYLYGGPCCEVFMPDAFTPNNDGHNDTYKPMDIEIHQLIKFMIVNRQGRVVFETNDPYQRWDGTYNGKPQGLGTFSYYIKYICADESEQERKGNFILIR